MEVGEWVAPWRLVCWKARVLLSVLALGGLLDLCRIFR